MVESHITVVIPTYNGENVVAKSIESVLKQDYHNIRVIVIDDGSDDTTLKVLKKFEDSVKIIKNEKNSLYWIGLL